MWGVCLLGQGHVDGLVQDCSNSTANAVELLQFCTKPSMYSMLVTALLYSVSCCGGPCDNGIT